MNTHNYLQHNSLESLMNENDSIDKDTRETLHNGDVSRGIGLLNIHTIPQYNK